MTRTPLTLLTVTAMTLGGVAPASSPRAARAAIGAPAAAAAAAPAAAPSPTGGTLTTTRPTTRAGGAGGPLVQPVAACKWGDLLSVAVRGGRLEVESTPPPDLAPYLVTGKSSLDVDIEDAHARYWRLQGIPPRPQRLAAGGKVVIAGGGIVRLAPGRAAPGAGGAGARVNVRPDPVAGAKPPPVDFTASRIARAELDEVVRPTRVMLMDGTFRLRGQMSRGGRFFQVDFQSHADRANCVLHLRESPRGRRGAGVSMEAADLPQLLRQRPREVRLYLEPMLTEICGGRNPLRPQAGDVYRTFPFIPADSGATEAVNRLVERFDELDPAARAAASAELERLGRPGVLAALRVDRIDLSAEQSLRLDAFVARHTSAPDLDAARRDPLFFVGCLEDEDRAVRAAALAALRETTGREIEFDIDAPALDRAAAAAEVAELFLPPRPEEQQD